MKKILFAAMLLSTLHIYAQENQLTKRDFWQDKPELAAVKAELKGFNFSEVTKGDDPLSMAINNDASIDVIKFLADQPGVNYKKDIHEGRTYLHSAASKGNAEATDLLLKKGSDMNYLDAHDQTALTYTAFMGKLTLPVLEVFVKNGLDVKKKYETKNNADILLMAIGSDKDMVITNYLLSKGLSLNATDKLGSNIFSYAARYGHVPTLKELVKKGVKPSNKDLLAAAQGPFRSANKIDVYQYLIDDLKLSATATNEAGQNVLHIIGLKANQDDIITYFLKKGVDVNKVDKDGNTPFINTASGKSVTIVEMMLPKVKNINAVNNKGESALLAAVKGSTSEVVELLIKNGADVKVSDKEGKNLAFYLVDSYRALGGRGGRGGFGGGTPQAAGAGNGTAAGRTQTKDDFGNKLKALQSKGLSFSAPQKDGNTLYHLAVTKNDLGILKKLADLNIDVNAKNEEGMTALHKAAMAAKDDTILKYLVSIGAKKDAVDSVNESAYDLAKENEFLAKGNVSIDFLK